MPSYLVKISPSDVGRTYFNDTTAVLVNASSANNAKATAIAEYGNAWVNCTADEVVSAGSKNWSGWSLEVEVVGVVKVSATTGTVETSMAQIAANVVTALNADAAIANASYNAGTLKIAAVADGLGDKKVKVRILSPDGVSYPFLVGTITDGGIAAADLTVVVPTANTSPSVDATFKSV